MLGYFHGFYGLQAAAGHYTGVMACALPMIWRYPSPSEGSGGEVRADKDSSAAGAESRRQGLCDGGCLNLWEEPAVRELEEVFRVANNGTSFKGDYWAWQSAFARTLDEIGLKFVGHIDGSYLNVLHVYLYPKTGLRLIRKSRGGNDDIFRWVAKIQLLRSNFYVPSFLLSIDPDSYYELDLRGSEERCSLFNKLGYVTMKSVCETGIPV
ncbi:MAG: hypothetical protein FJZ13_01770 [Candidatus Omnitrophica bacterium]|nr:hypothetical protein [Candidatus Omnitrophota bacterium]